MEIDRNSRKWSKPNIQRRNRLRIGHGDAAFQISNGIMMLGIALCAFLPFIMIVATSFNQEADIAKNGYAMIPRVFSLDAYHLVFSKGSRVYSAYGVTVFVTVVGTALSLLVTSMLAYGLSKKDLPGQRALTFMVFFTMLFSGGMIPWYLVCKTLGLTNSIWSMILPALVNTFYMFVIRNFYQSIPKEMEESARIDGASEAVLFFRIIMPLSVPALAAIGLFFAIEYWNSWYNALMFIRDIDKYPLQMLIREILSNVNSISGRMVFVGGNTPTESLKMAMVVVAAGPILLFYPFAQRYFVSGLMVGAVKG